MKAGFDLPTKQIETIPDFPKLQNIKKHLRKFIGMVNFYRHFERNAVCIY